MGYRASREALRSRIVLACEEEGSLVLWIVLKMGRFTALPEATLRCSLFCCLGLELGGVRGGVL